MVLTLVCLVVGLTVGAVVLYRSVVAASEKGDRMMLAVEARMDRAQADVSLVAQNVAALSMKAGHVADQASGWIDGYCIGSILLACFALGRNLYVRLTVKETKEGAAEQAAAAGRLRESTILKAFDALALVAIVPLVYTDGFGAALKLWRSLKMLCTMIRDAVSGYHLFSMVFASQKKDDVPFIGAGIQQEVAGVVEELAARVDEQKQGLEEEAARAATHSSSDEEEKSPQMPIAEPIITCPLCKVQGLRKDHLHGGALALSERSYTREQKAAHDGLRKIWDQTEDLVHLNKLKTHCQSKPWLMPLVLLCAFGVLLIVIRWLSKKEKKESESVPKGALMAAPTVLKEVKRSVTVKQDGSITISVDAEIPERKSNSANQQKKAADKKKKRHYDASGGDDDAQAQGLSDHKEDELLVQQNERDAERDAIYARGGKQALRDADLKVSMTGKKTMANDSMFEREAKSAEKHEHLAVESSEQKVCKTTNCKGTCGAFHNVKKKQSSSKKKAVKNLVCKRCKKTGHPANQCKAGLGDKCWCDKEMGLVCDLHYRPTPKVQKEAAKPAKPQEKSESSPAQPATVKITEKKEALVNGPRFNVSKVPDSVGYAEVSTADKTSTMNFTFVWNGMYVSKHIFHAGATEIKFSWGSECVVYKRTEGKDIGNDSLLFPRGQYFPSAVFLRSALPKVAEKCMVISYDSKEQMLKKEWMQDATTVTSVNAEGGAEKAYYSASTVAGSCASPVVNVDGKVIGFHNFTSSVVTGFIPVTTLMVAKATGSASSF